MPFLFRHRLVHIQQEALSRLADQATSAHEHAGLMHWADHQLPLVVTRQQAETGTQALNIGLPLPLAWGRLRLDFSLRRADVVVYTTFPSLQEVTSTQALPLQGLVDTLETQGLQALVYGSYGWQTLSGLSYVHEASDLDLLIHVSNTTQADLAAKALSSCEVAPLKLDGELMFPDGSAVAWREWLAWRSGATSQYLVKTLQGAHLTSSLPEPAALSAA